MLGSEDYGEGYLETSFGSAWVTTRTDAASVYRQAASLEWWDSQARRHELFVSDEVIVELSDPAYPGSVAALRFTGRVCARAGLLAPRILTPDLLWETDDDEADAQ